MAPRVRRRERPRGSIDVLPSGAVRVRVYAGQDPLTKKRHTLTKTIPAGPGAEKQAEAALDQMQREVTDRTAPRTSATVDQLLERYLEQFSGGENTLELYRGHVRNHISPLLGDVKVGKLTPETLDSFYAELRRCRAHCGGKRRLVDHRRVKGDHECDERCRPHRCRPLAPTTVRHIHFILSGAYKRAVRWRWVSVSPTEQVDPPPMPKPNPQPPTADEAARVITEAWRDPDWGTFLWIAMTTGARRGELCAIRRTSLNLEPNRETIWLKRAIRRSSSGWVEGDLKTHQQRRIALDPETVHVLQEHLERCASEAASAGVEWPSGAFLFSAAADGSTFATPDSVTQRYNRMVTRLGIDTTLHKLRHYSATELIAAGVDPRTVAGRLGHGGGGTTTLRTYTAWVSESDQRAARGLGAGMPQRPVQVDKSALIRSQPRHPYEGVAAAVARCIEAGALPPGSSLPSATRLADEHNVSVATAKRSLRLLIEWGMIIRFDRGTLVVAAR